MAIRSQLTEILASQIAAVQPVPMAQMGPPQGIRDASPDDRAARTLAEIRGRLASIKGDYARSQDLQQRLRALLATAVEMMQELDKVTTKMRDVMDFGSM